MGLAYKEDVDDMRESPTFHLMDGRVNLALRSISTTRISLSSSQRVNIQRTGCKSVEWNAEVVSSYDCVVIVTNHSRFNLKELVEFADLIVDTRNALSISEIESREGQVYKA